MESASGAGSARFKVERQRVWRSGRDIPPGCASERAALGLALLLFFQMLSRRALSWGDSVRSTFPLDEPLLSLRKEKPRERWRGEVGGWSMLKACRREQVGMAICGTAHDREAGADGGRQAESRRWC